MYAKFANLHIAVISHGQLMRNTEKTGGETALSQYESGCVSVRTTEKTGGETALCDSGCVSVKTTEKTGGETSLYENGRVS